MASPLQIAARQMHLGLLWEPLSWCPAGNMQNGRRSGARNCGTCYGNVPPKRALVPGPFEKPLDFVWARTPMQFGSESDYGKSNCFSREFVLRLLCACFF